MILKNPTWRGLSPSLPTFESAPDDLSERILKLLQMKGSVYSAYFNGMFSSHYRVVNAENKTEFYVKLINNQQLPRMRLAGEIEQWLNKQNIALAAFLPHLSQPFNGDTFMLVYPYVEGKRPEAYQADCENIGGALAVLHQKLSNYSGIETLKKETQERLSKLNWCREQVSRGTMHSKMQKERMLELAKRAELSFESSWHSPTPLHGDLNLGNILIDQDRAVHFLDYEDTVHSFLPVVYELSFLIERLILVNEPDDAKALSLGQALIKAYRQQGGVYHYHEKDKYCLAAINLRSLCTLILCQSRDIDIVDDEWQKFFSLLDMAEKRAKLFEAILTS